MPYPTSAHSPLPSQVYRIEFEIPAIARPEQSTAWHTSIELPVSLTSLDPDDQMSAIEAIAEAVAEQRRINAQHSGTSAEAQPRDWLMMNLAIWMRRVPGRGWRSSVNICWPTSWQVLGVEARDAVLESMQRSIDEAVAAIRAGLAGVAAQGNAQGFGNAAFSAA